MSKSGKIDSIILEKSIYGQVLADRQCNKMGRVTLKKVDFTRGNVNPWINMKENKKGVAYITLYVDNNLLMGYPEAKEEPVVLLEKNGLIL